jgi:hypothetical protein
MFSGQRVVVPNHAILCCAGILSHSDYTHIICGEKEIIYPCYDLYVYKSFYNPKHILFFNMLNCYSTKISMYFILYVHCI